MELIIAVSIISFLTAIILPSFSILERAELKKAASELKMTIIYAQNKSIKESKRHYVKFFKEQNVYIVGHEIFKPLDKKINLSDNIEIGQMVFNTPNKIQFTTRGTSGSSGTIYLQSKNFKLKLTVVPGTGRVKIYAIEKR